MKKYELVQCYAEAKEGNDIINVKSKDGWELIPPISVTAAVFNEHGLVNPATFFMTFMKES